MSEWLKEHAWKACVGETLPWVRIPLSPPSNFAHEMISRERWRHLGRHCDHAQPETPRAARSVSPRPGSRVTSQGTCTWHPLFDHADDYHRTVYEENSVLNWFRGILQTDSGSNASKMSLQWCRNVLRMVTPHMWVCRALLQQVDRAALEPVAQVSETNDVFKIALREPHGLDDLELTLLPVLSVESVRVLAA
jgi:hypothetical protein